MKGRILDFIAKRKMRKVLREFVSPEALDQLLESRALDTPKIQPGRIEFVFTFVRAENPEQLAERIGHVTDVGMQNDATIHNIIGPMIVMAYGTGRWGEPSGSREQLVSQLQLRFGGDIKIVHGAADGHFGSFGGEKFLAFTFTFPRFDQALATLGRLEFGAVEEFRP